LQTCSPCSSLHHWDDTRVVIMNQGRDEREVGRQIRIDARNRGRKCDKQHGRRRSESTPETEDGISRNERAESPQDTGQAGDRKCKCYSRPSSSVLAPDQAQMLSGLREWRGVCDQPTPTCIADARTGCGWRTAPRKCGAPISTPKKRVRATSLPWFCPPRVLLAEPRHSPRVPTGGP
jgi:hypothetical protein